MPNTPPTTTNIPQSFGLGYEIANEAIKRVSLSHTPTFISRYFKDEKGQPIQLAQFQIEAIERIEAQVKKDPKDPTRKNVLVLMPAAHGKTTLISKDTPIKWMVENPNLRIMHIMNTSTEAEQNLASIKAELEDTESQLYKDFGPFRSDNWKATEINLKGRTIKEKDPTWSALGGGSNVIGHRADIIIVDDVCDLVNSGPYASERTRQMLYDWFFQAVMKVAAPHGIVIVIGTVMDFRDLYHSIMKMPDNWEVIRLKAIIDDETKEILWPERYTYEWLAAQRSADLVSFLKRFQNEALETSLLTFPADDMAACRDFDRRWGEITEEMRRGGFTTVINSMDPTSGQTKRSKWCGWVSLAYNPKQQEPRDYYVLELFHFRAPIEVPPEKWEAGEMGQVNHIVAKHKQYGARATVIEANGAHQYLLQSQTLQAFKMAGNVVDPHYTSDKNKPDPEVGVPSLSPIVRAHLLHFPYGDPESRRWVDYFFQEEMGKHPQADTTDILMALWFAIMKAKSLAGWQRQKIRHALPKWAQVGRLATPERVGPRTVVLP